jgi:hypothetical protein
MLLLSLEFGDRLTILAETWHVSGPGQALGIWVAVFGRARRRMNWLWRLAVLLGITFCAVVSHFRASGARCSFGRDELDKSTLA